MVSQFLRLSKQEQFRIIEQHPELIKAGKIFIHGENWFYGVATPTNTPTTNTTPLSTGSDSYLGGEKSEEVIMAKYIINVEEEKKEVGNDLMDEEGVDEMNYIGETIKQVYTRPFDKKDDAKLITANEIYDGDGNDDNDDDNMKMDYVKDDGGDDIKIQKHSLQRLDDKKLVTIEEIVEVIHIILSELNMQVS